MYSFLVEEAALDTQEVVEVVTGFVTLMPSPRLMAL
jgi:hypothetical protein